MGAVRANQQSSLINKLPSSRELVRGVFHCDHDPLHFSDGHTLEELDGTAATPLVRVNSPEYYAYELFGDYIHSE